MLQGVVVTNAVLHTTAQALQIVGLEGDGKEVMALILDVVAPPALNELLSSLHDWHQRYPCPPKFLLTNQCTIVLVLLYVSTGRTATWFLTRIMRF